MGRNVSLTFFPPVIIISINGLLHMHTHTHHGVHFWIDFLIWWMLNLILLGLFSERSQNWNAKKCSSMWNERIYSLTHMDFHKGSHKTPGNNNNKYRTKLYSTSYFLTMEQWSTKKTCPMERKKDFSREQAENAHNHTPWLFHTIYMYMK